MDKHYQIKKGVYKHFKGNFYEVIDVAFDSENCKQMIVYRALYGENQTWVRPYDSFIENVEVEGVKKPRFEYCHELSAQSVMKIPMRREKNEVFEINEVNKIIDESESIRLSFYSGLYPYIVTLNFGHIYENEKHIFYFHSASTGRKVDLIRKNGKASFQLDCCGQLVSGSLPCNYSYNYSSIFGEGEIKIIDDVNEKRFALNSIMKKYSKSENNEFSSKSSDNVLVIKLTVEYLTCKIH